MAKLHAISFRTRFFRIFPTALLKILCPPLRFVMKSTMNFGQRLYSFYAALSLEASFPSGVQVMNPYQRPETLQCVRAFCERYYGDENQRVSIWGINPGRFGGGLTGLSFTDPVILRDVCGIETPFGTKQELSAEYVWSVIREFGGAERFFSSFFLTALCPLGFVQEKEQGKVNYNFYDDPQLFRAVKPFMIETMQQQLALGLRRDVAICFGAGKLQKAFEAINKEHSFFERIVALEHPRFIMQYRRKQLQDYRRKYCSTLENVLL